MSLPDQLSVATLGMAEATEVVVLDVEVELVVVELAGVTGGWAVMVTGLPVDGVTAVVAAAATVVFGGAVTAVVEGRGARARVEVVLDGEGLFVAAGRGLL